MTKDNSVNAMQAMGCSMNSENLSFDWQTVNGTGCTGGNCNNSLAGGTSQANYTIQPSMGAWDYWQNWYYPQVIHTSYPVYIQEKARDDGKHAFEIVKALKDKGLLKLDKVEDFIEAMDCVIKNL